MNKNTLSKLFWVFWCSTTILTGILAGYMVSHSIMLGRFFNWFIESGNEDLLHQTYTVFREASNAHIVYDIPLYLAFVCGFDTPPCCARRLPFGRLRAALNRRSLLGVSSNVVLSAGK